MHSFREAGLSHKSEDFPGCSPGAVGLASAAMAGRATSGFGIGIPPIPRNRRRRTVRRVNTKLVAIGRYRPGMLRFRTKVTDASVVGAALLVAVGGATAAAPGSLDSRFGGTGAVVTDLGAQHDVATDVALQADGKILAAGVARFASGADFAIVRYLPNGSLDPTFDGDGKVISDLGGDEVGRAVAVQADGKIVVAGERRTLSTDFAIARYNADGSLDSTFGQNGTVFTDFGKADSALDVAIQPDGKILAAGIRFDSLGVSSIAVARYGADGSRDQTFGAGGTLVDDSANGGDAIALLPDGKLAVVGPVWSGSTLDTVLLRLTAAGARDSSFGNGGRVVASLTGSDDLHALVVQPDGKLVVAGETNVSWIVARFTADGTLDPAFDNDGRTITDVGGVGEAYDVALQRDGKILVAGHGLGSAGGGSDLILVRYNTDGSLDSTFGTGGRAFTQLGAAEAATGLAISPRGLSVVAGGRATAIDVADFVVARYIVDGSAPLLTLPSTVRIDATTPTGATASYGVSASDDLDDSPTVACSPQSGTVLPIGITTVVCTAADASENAAGGNFQVVVLGATQQIDNLATQVKAVNAKQGVADSLDAKLQNVLDALNSAKTGDKGSACNKLDSFINEVRAQTGAGKSLTQADADRLIADAQRIKAVIGCA
jgi:uncharacterized delta-60 repeat protein